jgi:hypothetical protein
MYPYLFLLVGLVLSGLLGTFSALLGLVASLCVLVLFLFAMK